MGSQQEIDRGDSFRLTSEEKANGFSAVADGQGNITLLKKASANRLVFSDGDWRSAQGIPRASQRVR